MGLLQLAMQRAGSVADMAGPEGGTGAGLTLVMASGFRRESAMSATSRQPGEAPAAERERGQVQARERACRGMGGPTRAGPQMHRLGGPTIVVVPWFQMSLHGVGQVGCQ
jgi:hypothetical protein